MAGHDLHIVTGAFGYSGKYIARLLLEKGKRVRTLTGHPDRSDPLRDQIEIFPFSFENPRALVENLRGATAFYNTYWVRFSHGRVSYDLAVENTRVLIRAAVEAGVKRFVHISITNPSEQSPLPYFRGKALLERALVESGLSYAILRPTVLFGKEDILVNNIAWLLRRLPVFGVIGKGDYKIQPVYVSDLAALAVETAERTENVVLDAVGPEIYSFEEMVRLIRRHVGSRAWIVHVTPSIARLVARVLGWAMNDVLITRDEIAGLTANLLVSDKPPSCPTRLSDWLERHSAELGVHYSSELTRHYR